MKQRVMIFGHQESGERYVLFFEMSISPHHVINPLLGFFFGKYFDDESATRCGEGYITFLIAGRDWLVVFDGTKLKYFCGLLKEVWERKLGINAGKKIVHIIV